MWGYPVKIGSPHFVDFGKDMEHSPDGKAYLVAHGAVYPDARPRFENLSWITGDQVYLLRVIPTPENINDASQYEFFGGNSNNGEAIDRVKASNVTVDGVRFEWCSHRRPTWCSGEGWKGLALAVQPVEFPARKLLLEFRPELTTSVSSLKRPRPSVSERRLTDSIDRLRGLDACGDRIFPGPAVARTGPGRHPHYLHNRTEG